MNNSSKAHESLNFVARKQELGDVYKTHFVRIEICSAEFLQIKMNWNKLNSYSPPDREVWPLGGRGFFDERRKRS